MSEQLQIPGLRRPDRFMVYQCAACGELVEIHGENSRAIENLIPALGCSRIDGLPPGENFRCSACTLALQRSMRGIGPG